MITQSFKSGENEIRFENAESLEDAKANGFSNGIYSRQFVNGKPVENYHALIRFIVDSTQKTGKSFIPPNDAELKKLQQEVLRKQGESMREQLVSLRNQYKTANAPEHLLKEMDAAIEKIDLAGVRVSR